MNKRNTLKLVCTLLTAFLSHSIIFSQPSKGALKKYTSILWEITGKGTQKPSYLFGTMHVSNKMVFNLGDSFYHAIEAVDNVGLELDPGYWQEHFSKTSGGDLTSIYSLLGNGDRNNQNRGLYKAIFSIDAQEKRIERTMAMEPTMINSLLYRKSEYNQDREEDTYLDMYLYQICNKLNKQVVGLEIIDTSERLMKEAQLAMRDEKRTTSYDDMGYASVGKIEDAYKSGDLDLLDSLHRIQMPSKKFRAIFLDYRNEIQAKGIDSVIKLRKTIFAGVGAAHLPGENGVIEILRKMGYKLRPVKMTERNSSEKDRIDKIRYPVKFTTQYSPDSVVKAAIPGKWYRFEKAGNVLQFADLANGSYYMLGRVPTEGLFQGQTTSDVLRKVDSMLYENIPGRIISKKPIEKNGYKGFDITNRTRRGDAQHYQIFVTPFEVIMAKMSGSMDYVLEGREATEFFASISIKQLEHTAPLRFTPAWGAFSVSLPHTPFIQTRSSNKSDMPVAYEATDVKKGIHYCIMKETLQRSSYLEEDSFELNLLHESYMSSKVFEKELSKKFVTQHGYPALEASYQLKDGNYSIVRYVIQGPHYYCIIAEQKKQFSSTPETLTSFTIEPFKYDKPKLQKDSVFGYSFMSPVPIPDKGNKAEMNLVYKAMEKLNSGMSDMVKRTSMLNLQHDSTGEAINLTAIKFPAYTFIKDSAKFRDQLDEISGSGEKATCYTRKKRTEKKAGWDIHETWYADTNSSRELHYKTFYKQGVAIVLSQYTDTLSEAGSFAQSVFDSFLPADSLTGINPFQPKGTLFFSEYASKDSATHGRALSNLSAMTFTKDEVPVIERLLSTLSWDQPNYLGIKTRFIKALGNVEDIAATNLLTKLYTLANDTAFYQEEILNSLLAQKTVASFKAFESLVTTNPPVEVNTNLGKDADGIKDDMMAGMAFDGGLSRQRKSLSYDRNNSREGWDNLSDTMQLTKAILPNLLNLLNLDDYKEKVQNLLLEMTDSGFVAANDVKPFYTKFLLEGKHWYKKAVAQENTDGMKKKAKELNKENDKTGDEDESGDDDILSGYNRFNNNRGSDDQFGNLYEHLVLLTPFYETEPAVKALVQQCFNLQNKEFRYKLMKLMIRKKNHQYPDSLSGFFARDEKIRRRLYNFLNTQDQLEKFPKAYLGTLDLARSRMAALGSGKPDTVSYVGLRPFDWERKKGEMYFFKYKMKKEDKWKWAMVGMLPGNKKATWDVDDSFDKMLKRRVETDKTIDEQMDIILKETLYSQRQSAKNFYRDNDNERSFLLED
ncbi:MAG: TraB/GumN family protein [Bacteroidota bacterium]